jgi:hypothetical protein
MKNEITYQNTIGKHATGIRHHNQNIYVRYHATDVVVFDNEWVKLNNGGHFTPTTKRRMNQTSQHFGLGFNVYQKKFAWYVDTPHDGTQRINDSGHFSFRR